MFASFRTRTASRSTWVALIILVASLLIFSTGAHAQTAPVVVDLGTLGGCCSSAIAVSASGHVVGNSATATGLSHAFSWTAAGGMTDLGTLGGSYSDAFAVNEAGQVVGRSQIAGDVGTHAFLWTAADGMIDLGTLGGRFSYAQAVNDAGQVVGLSSLAGEASVHAFLWTAAGGMVDLGTLGGRFSYAVAVNEAGQVVGSSLTANELIGHAFLWTAASGMIDLGTLGGPHSVAYAVNDAGQVVGSSSGDASFHAFSWTAAGGMIDLGGDSALAVNDAGQVVGYGSFDASIQAFSWTAADGMIDLGTLGGYYSYAHAVNDAGQVVGFSTTAGDDHAFLWTAAGGMIDLGTLGGSASRAVDLNDGGDVVGFSHTPTGEYHATLWKFTDSLPERLVVHDVQASSELTFILEASHAVDGDPLTRWSSEFSDSQFIQMDLGQDTPFDRIVLRWESARAAEYEIQVSSDEETWSTLRRVAASGDVDDLSDLVASARYVRMQGLKRATHWGYSLFEFEVYRDGVNIAVGRPMTASSTERIVFPSSLSVDGDPSTRWSSDFADAQWFAVDLGVPARLDRVVLKWEAAYAAGYDLVVSDDALSWTTVRTVTNADGGLDALTDLTAEGRYVGLLLHRRGTLWGFSLWEFEAYGLPTGTAP